MKLKTPKKKNQEKSKEIVWYCAKTFKKQLKWCVAVGGGGVNEMVLERCW